MAARGSRSRLERVEGLAPGEPHFVLRAGDRLAPEHVEAWAIEAELNGYPPARVADARRVAVAMRHWSRRKSVR